MSGYVSNVPLSNQSLGQTQPTINTNFTVLNTNFGVDHVDFTNAPPAMSGNGGRHNTVTLVQQASDPTAVTTSPILYSKSTTSNTVNNDIYFRRASNDASTVVQLTTTKVNPTASTNGYTFLPGGIILQWGFVNSPSDDVKVNFPITFPTGVFTCVATPVKSGSISNLAFSMKQVPSTSGFIPRISGTTLDAISFYAIGN